jgi:hypothetical protein
MMAVVPGLCIGAIELALASTERPGSPAMVSVFSKLANMVPGPNPQWPDPDAPSFVKCMDDARRLQNDPQWVRPALARQGMRALPPRGLRFSDERRSIYGRELGGTVTLLATLLVLSALEDRRRFLELAFVGLTAIDLWVLSRKRHFDLGPVRPLTAQSPVLDLLSRESPGRRVLGPARNLPMAAAAAPLLCYRTLDLPALETLTRLAEIPRFDDEAKPITLAMLRATGTSFAILDPTWTELFERNTSEIHAPEWQTRRLIHDVALAGWLYGTDLVALEGPDAATFTVWRPAPPAARAWLAPLTPRELPTILDSPGDELEAVLRVLGPAVPLELRSQVPERLDLTVDADGPAAVIVSQLSDPQWEGRWIGPDGRAQPAEVLPVFRSPLRYGWQAIHVPGPGRWTLHLEYVARDVQAGLIVSGVSFLVLIGLAVVLRPGHHSLKAVSP